MTILLDHYNRKYIVTTQADDLSAENMLEIFCGMLNQAGYNVNDYLEQFRS